MFRRRPPATPTMSTMYPSSVPFAERHSQQRAYADGMVAGNWLGFAKRSAGHRLNKISRLVLKFLYTRVNVRTRMPLYRLQALPALSSGIAGVSKIHCM